MRVYILDWRGTLTRLGNPCQANGWCDKDAIKAFLDAIHARGDKTAGYSALLPRYARGWFSFQNSKDLKTHAERLAFGEKAKVWPSPWGPECDGPAERYYDRETRKEFDPTNVTEVVFSDDVVASYDTEMKEIMMEDLTNRIEQPFRFVHPSDLHKEVK